MTLLVHHNIERARSRIWDKSYLNTVVKECEEAGYDVLTTQYTIVIGLQETNQVFLRAMQGTGGWLTRYDRKLFDESAK